MQYVNPRVSVITDGLHIECEVGDPDWVECGESKLAKMACSGSLAPHCVNNDYVTAAMIYSTAHARHELLARHGLLGAVRIYELHLQKWQHFCCSMAVSIRSATRGENRTCLLLQLLCQPGETVCCASLCYGCLACHSQQGENKRVYNSYHSWSLLPTS